MTPDILGVIGAGGEFDARLGQHADGVLRSVGARGGRGIGELAKGVDAQQFGEGTSSGGREAVELRRNEEE